MLALGVTAEHMFNKHLILNKKVQRIFLVPGILLSLSVCYGNMERTLQNMNIYTCIYILRM